MDSVCIVLFLNFIKLKTRLAVYGFSLFNSVEEVKVTIFL